MILIVDDSLLSAFEEGVEYPILFTESGRPYVEDRPKDGSFPSVYYVEDLLYHHVKFTVK